MVRNVCQSDLETFYLIFVTADLLNGGLNQMTLLFRCLRWVSLGLVF